MSSTELDRWQQRYSAPGYLFGTTPNAFLKAQAHLLPKSGTALAIADGEGRNGVFLAEQGLDVLSIDFSPLAQQKAKKLAAQRGVRLRTEQADLTAWRWPEAAYDVVAGIFFQFATPPERECIFASIKRALKPSGLLLIEGYTPKRSCRPIVSRSRRPRMTSRVVSTTFSVWTSSPNGETDGHAPTLRSSPPCSAWPSTSGGVRSSAARSSS